MSMAITSAPTRPPACSEVRRVHGAPSRTEIFPLREDVPSRGVNLFQPALGCARVGQPLKLGPNTLVIQGPGHMGPACVIAEKLARRRLRSS